MPPAQCLWKERCRQAGRAGRFDRAAGCALDGTELGAGTAVCWVVMWGIQSSQFGRYQFHLPSSFIVEGTNTARTIVASIRIAAASPTPIILMSIISSVAKIANTATINDRGPGHDPRGRSALAS
jgi:hypothetical protein